MIEDLKPLLKKFIVFAKNNLSFERPPRLFLKQDTANQKCMLGKTAHYDPQNQAITLYISGRHPKDILRSFAHELVHHCQNERGDLHPDKMKTITKQYAQENPHMRKMEQEAYLMGNMCFRDWEDGLDDKTQYKMRLAEQKFLKENKNMSVKISKKELKGLIEKLLKERAKEEEPRGTKLKIESELEEGGCGKHSAGKNEDEPEAVVEEGEACGPHGVVGCSDCASGTLEENEESQKKFTKGQKAMYNGEEVTVEVANGPGNLIGIMVDGKVKMVKPSELSPAKSSKKRQFEPENSVGSSAPDTSDKSKESQKESKIQTPEQENALYESRFTQKNTRLFEKLLKEWTK